MKCSFGFFAFLGALVARPGGARRRLPVSARFAGGVEVKVGVSPSYKLVWAGASRGAEPKSRRCRHPGATDGRHGRCRAKGCPQIGSQHMRQGYTHPLQGLLRRRLWPERATQHFVSARAYSAASGADTSDSLRCDARSTRARRRTPPPHHIDTGRTVRLCAVRIRASRRGTAPALWMLQLQALGVVAPAPAAAFA